MFRLNTAGQLGVGERCVNADNQGVKLVVCRLGSVDGPWQYDEVRDEVFALHLYLCLTNLFPVLRTDFENTFAQSAEAVPCGSSNNTRINCVAM